MKLEHVALDVSDPEAFKSWWCANLGLTVSAAASAFLLDDSGRVAVEVYRTDRTAAAPDYRAMNSMALHFAFLSDDVDADVARLVAAGATSEEVVHKPGFDMAIVRDPWGVPIQLCKRATSVLL